MEKTVCRYVDSSSLGSSFTVQILTVIVLHHTAYMAGYVAFVAFIFEVFAENEKAVVQSHVSQFPLSIQLFFE